MQRLEPGCLALITNHELSPEVIGRTVTCGELIPKGTETEYGRALWDLWTIDIQVKSENKWGHPILVNIIQAAYLLRIGDTGTQIEKKSERWGIDLIPLHV